MRSLARELRVVVQCAVDNRVDVPVVDGETELMIENRAIFREPLEEFRNEMR